MSVGAGSIKRAAKTAGKKKETVREAETATGMDGKEIMPDTAVEEKQASNTKAAGRKKRASTAEAITGGKETAVGGSGKKGKSSLGKKEKTTDKSSENMGEAFSCGIGQQLPTYLL